MPHQEALSVIATIKPGRVETLKGILGTIADHVNDWNLIPFTALNNVHFGRLIVFDDSTGVDGTAVPAQLALMTNVDAPLDAHMHELATLAAVGIDRVFGECAGYPDTEHRTTSTRMAFLREHHVRSKAFYANQQGRTVTQIRQEEELRRAVNDYLDSVELSQQSPDAVRRAIIEFVRAEPRLQWALSPAEGHYFAWRLNEFAHRTGVAVMALVLSPLLLVLSPLFVVLLRSHEKRDVPDTSQASPQRVQQFRADEDYWVQNQVVAAGRFKPGVFRRLTSNAILLATDYACRHIYNRGSLSGLNTIHFARWTPLDGGRMSFSSNYDGSLESYMNDFIDKAAWGLNAIFSNGEGFPRTSFLFCGGITDEKAYKRFLPTRQVQSRVWYSAYPHLSTKNIANNAAIRKGLSDDLSIDDTKTWLARFGVSSELPAPGLIARFLDGLPWDKLCRRCS